MVHIYFNIFLFFLIIIYAKVEHVYVFSTMQNIIIIFTSIFFPTATTTSTIITTFNSHIVLKEKYI